jgi:hypothetical protein
VVYWKQFFPEFAEAIRLKLAELGDTTHGSAYDPGGFNVFGFIDNTTFPTCRPGSDSVGYQDT